MRIVTGAAYVVSALYLVDLLGLGPLIVERVRPALGWEGMEFPRAIAGRAMEQSRTAQILEHQQQASAPDNTAPLDDSARPFSQGLGMVPSLFSGAGLPADPAQLGCTADSVKPTNRMTKAEYNAHQSYNAEGLDLAVGTGRLSPNDAFCKRSDGAHVFLASWANWALIVHPNGRQEAKQYATR